jgi:hypothetical protein
VIGEALAISVEQAQDAALFSANAAVVGTSPAGLLNGLTPLTSTGSAGGGAAAVATDLGALAATISHHGVNIDDLIFVTTAAIATKIRTLAGPFFQDVVLSSAAIPDGEIIAIVPQGLATGYSGEVQIETSIAATLHFESATPLPIASVGTPNTIAAPVHSAFQENLILVKIRGRMAWAVQPNAVAFMTGVAW